MQCIFLALPIHLPANSPKICIKETVILLVNVQQEFLFLSLQCLRVRKFLLLSHHGFLLHPWCHGDNAVFLQRQASTRTCRYDNVNPFENIPDEDKEMEDIAELQIDQEEGTEDIEVVVD